MTGTAYCRVVLPTDLFPASNIIPPPINHCDHVSGDRRLKGEPFTGDRVVKCEGAGVKRLAGEKVEAVAYELLVFCECCSFKNPVASVFLIVEEGMPLPGHMNPNLVGTACLEAALYK